MLIFLCMFDKCNSKSHYSRLFIASTNGKFTWGDLLSLNGLKTLFNHSVISYDTYSERFFTLHFLILFSLQFYLFCRIVFFLKKSNLWNQKFTLATHLFYSTLPLVGLFLLSGLSKTSSGAIFTVFGLSCISFVSFICIYLSFEKVRSFEQ